MAGGVTRNAGESRGRALLARVKAWSSARAVPSAQDPTGLPRARAQRWLSASRLIVMLAIIAAATTLACGGIGYVLARQSDEHRAFEQRQALRGAISEFRALFGPTGEIDPRFVRMIEQSAGLKGLKFDTEPGPPGARCSR